jgi:RNA polymerase sigma factor for flagellar operon FliA
MMKSKMTRLPGNLNPIFPCSEIAPGSACHDTQGSGFFTSRDQLILDHLPMVKVIAVRVHKELPIHVELDDLVHAGVLGLFDAVKKYDPEKQVPFASYAKYRIKGAILDGLRQLDWASREMRRRYRQVEAAKVELSATPHRAPTEIEIAEKLGLGMLRFRKIVLDLRGADPISCQSFANQSQRAPAGPPRRPARSDG